MDSAETVKVVSIMKAIRNEEEAVSPVIGVILMVAIVVILAAVIAAFVFGMAGSVQGSKSVAATAKYVDQNTVEITYQGGTDDSKLVYLKFVVNGVYGVSTATGGSITAASSGATGVKPEVGAKFYMAGGPVTTNAVTVVAIFTDGAEQVILDTQV